jgi:hypothetical protein
VICVSTRFLPWKPGFFGSKNPVSKAETGLKTRLDLSAAVAILRRFSLPRSANETGNDPRGETMRNWIGAAALLIGVSVVPSAWAQDRFGGGVDPREIKFKELDTSHLAAPIMAPVPQSSSGIKGWFSKLPLPTWLGGKKQLAGPVAPTTNLPKQRAKNPYQPLKPISMSQ